MNGNSLLRIRDLVDNPTPRVPICLCLDTSASMDAVEGECTPTGQTVFKDGKTWNVVTGGNTRIDELQKGIDQFYDSIRKDDIAVYSAEISIVTFNSSAQCVMDFANIDRQSEVPKLVASGDTAMGEGVNLALDLLETRKKEYKDKGVDYYQSWLVLMTDGTPNGSKAELDRAAARISKLVLANKLTVFPIAIGNESDMSSLARLSPNTPPIKLQGLRFSEFFQWLSQSVSATSQYLPGEKIILNYEKDIQGWGSL